MDFKAEAKKMAADKLKSYGGSSKGGFAASFGSKDGSAKTSSRKGYATGGIVDGGTSAPRMDRPSSGSSSKKAGTVVNIIVGKDENQQPPMPPMAPPMAAPPPRPPMPPPAPPMGGPGGPPGGPMGGPPGAGGPPGMPPGAGGPPGMPPMGGRGLPPGIPMHARGGRVAYKDGGSVGKEIADVKKSLPKSAGGPKATSLSPKIEGAGGGGLGRLEKIKDYGSRSS